MYGSYFMVKKHGPTGVCASRYTYAIFRSITSNFELDPGNFMISMDLLCQNNVISTFKHPFWVSGSGFMVQKPPFLAYGSHWRTLRDFAQYLKNYTYNHQILSFRWIYYVKTMWLAPSNTHFRYLVQVLWPKNWNSLFWPKFDLKWLYHLWAQTFPDLEFPTKTEYRSWNYIS